MTTKRTSLLDAVKVAGPQPVDFASKEPEPLLPRHGTYYTEECGRELQPILNDIMASQQEKLFLYKEVDLKPRSILAKITQSWLWLIDNDDRQRVYALLRERCYIKIEGFGVAIRFKNRKKALAANFSGKAASKEIVISEEQKTWKSELLKIIGEERGSMEFHSVVLSAEEVEWARRMAGALRPLGLESEIDTNIVKLAWIKTNIE